VTLTCKRVAIVVGPTPAAAACCITAFSCGIIMHYVDWPVYAGKENKRRCRSGENTSSICKVVCLLPLTRMWPTLCMPRPSCLLLGLCAFTLSLCVSMSLSRSRVFPGVCAEAPEGVTQGAPRAHTWPPNPGHHKAVLYLPSAHSWSPNKNEKNKRLRKMWLCQSYRANK